MKILEKLREKWKTLGNSYNFQECHNFLSMEKIRNIIWTDYNGGFDRKAFKKFLEIGNEKFKKLTTFQKFHDFLRGFGQKYKNI